MVKKIFLFLVLSAYTLGINAQNYSWGDGQDGKYHYTYVQNDPANAKFYILDNGLTVILSENKDKPRIQTIIATKAGSKTDPSTHTGLAHYLEHMLFKGTDQYGSLDWKKEQVYLDMIDDLYEQYNSTKNEKQRKAIYKKIDSVSGIASKYAIANEYDKMAAMIGAQGTNAFTSFEQTAYINDIPSNQIDRWLAIEAERFRNPILRIFHTELEAVYEEKNRSLDSDGDKVFEKLFAELFKKHNYGLQTTIGKIDHLKNPSLKEIRKYFHKNYVPNNMCLIMSGDFNSSEVIRKVDKAFAYMQPKNVPPYTFEKETPITSPRISTIYGPDAEYVTMAFRFPGANSKEALILDLMSSVLSNGNAGLMDLNLVKKQKVISAGGGAYVLKDYGILYIEGKAKEGQALEDVRNLILGELEKLKNGDFSPSLLKAVINNYKKYQIQSNERNSGRAYALLDAFISDLDWKRNVEQLDVMNNISKADIQAFAKKWLRNNYVCIYKKIGKDPNALKVEKPSITPVSVNRDAQSEFVTQIAKTKTAPIAPRFLDYQKDIDRTSILLGKRAIDVLGVQNKNNSLFTQYYYINIGSHHNKKLPIAMKYLEYLGTDKYSAEAISKQFYTMACDFGVSTGKEKSYVYLSGLQENYKNALQLFEDLLANCQADDQALEKMIAGIKKKRKNSKLNKGAIRSGLRSYAIYGADNPFNYNLSNDELDALTAQELINLIHDIIKYDHQILYYGPKKVASLAPTLTKYHRAAVPVKRAPKKHQFIYQKQTENQVLMAHYDMVQAEIMWLRNNELFDTKKLPYINMFNEYFGGNMSGIVFQDIRESKALAYSSYASYGIPSKKDEPFYMLGYIGCQADKMKESIEAMQALFTILPKSERLFSNSKNSLLNSISTNRITKSSILFSYLDALDKGVDYDLRKNTFDGIKNMTFNDINSFHQENISNKNYTLTVVGSKDKLDMKTLADYGQIKQISLSDIFGY